MIHSLGVRSFIAWCCVYDDLPVREVDAIGCGEVKHVMGWAISSSASAERQLNEQCG